MNSTLQIAQDDWMDIQLPADRLETVELRLADNSVRQGVWTGGLWWSGGEEVAPVAWRPIRKNSQLRTA